MWAALTARFPPAAYLNVVMKVATAATGVELLGYATFPFDGGASNFDDGVVVAWTAYGGAGCALSRVNNDGATLTHEVGHYLGLYHTFHDAGGGGETGTEDCGAAEPPWCHQTGDLLCDTPPQRREIFDCIDRRSCGSRDPVENFMDYSRDTCLASFTDEQARRMRCTLSTSRAGIVSTVEALALTAAPATPPGVAAAPEAPPLTAPTAVPPLVAQPAPCHCRCSWSHAGKQYAACAHPNGTSERAWCYTTFGSGCVLPDGTIATTPHIHCDASQPVPHCLEPPSPPSPSPPPPSPPCQCRTCGPWAFGAAQVSTFCGNPDADPRGPWCLRRGATGVPCTHPIDGYQVSTNYFYCASVLSCDHEPIEAAPPAALGPPPPPSPPPPPLPPSPTSPSPPPPSPPPPVAPAPTCPSLPPCASPPSPTWPSSPGLTPPPSRPLWPSHASPRTPPSPRAPSSGLEASQQHEDTVILASATAGGSLLLSALLLVACAWRARRAGMRVGLRKRMDLTAVAEKAKVAHRTATAHPDPAITAPSPAAGPISHALSAASAGAQERCATSCSTSNTLAAHDGIAHDDAVLLTLIASAGRPPPPDDVRNDDERVRPRADEVPPPPPPLT